MRKNAYSIMFVDGCSIEEWAFSAEQAKILAQAKRIERGEDYTVVGCEYLGPVAA